jgi:soluble lytic murein transglycosylase-like protein
MFKVVENSPKLSPESSTLLVWSVFAVALCVVVAYGYTERSEGQAVNNKVQKAQMTVQQAAPEVAHDLILANHFPYNDPVNDMVEDDPFPFATEIRSVSERMDVEAGLIYAIVKAESSFRTQVKSTAGAVGLMQVIAHAAGKDAWQKVLKESGKPAARDLKDPYTNLLLGSAYIKLLNEHHFDNVKDPELRQGLVLAAYNWGPSNVKKMLKKGQPRDLQELHWSLFKRAPKETYNYVKRVLRYKAQFEDNYSESA